MSTPMGHFVELNHSWWRATLSASYVFVGIGMLVGQFLVQPLRRTG